MRSPFKNVYFLEMCLYKPCNILLLSSLLFTSATVTLSAPNVRSSDPSLSSFFAQMAQRILEYPLIAPDTVSAAHA